MGSKLEEYLSNELYTRFGQYSIRRNYYPEWLKESAVAVRLQLDFYIDELKIAAEVQGDQHYTFSAYFHKNMDGFLALQERDKAKQILCKKNGVELHEIFTFLDADLFVQKIIEVNAPKVTREKKPVSREELEKLEDALKFLGKALPDARKYIEQKNYKPLVDLYAIIKSKRISIQNFVPSRVKEDFLAEIREIERRCGAAFDERRKDPEAMKEARKHSGTGKNKRKKIERKQAACRVKSSSSNF